jgi:hypothetical protein
MKYTIKQLENELKKVNNAIEQKHTFYNGKPINALQQWLLWEIETRKKHGNKTRQAFLK